MNYYGFNFQWMFIKKEQACKADEKALDFMQDLGLNFARLPVDYRFWTVDTDYLHPDHTILGQIFEYYRACTKRNIHFCLNLHRAPGYCINANHLEKHNLWQDKIAQDGFVFIWETFARLFKGIPGELVSFDLLNEPPDVGQYGLTREIHRHIIKRTVEAVLAIDPGRTIVIDGLNGGNWAMPELNDLPVTQSTRGYQPMALTHLGAQWCKEVAGIKEAVYPGTDWYNLTWDKNTLTGFYRPWRNLQAGGVPVHVGEFGCYNTVENRYALNWFSDLLSLYKEWKWGYSLWNFEGSFGIINHGRPGVQYKEYNGYNVDKQLLELFLENRVTG